MKRASIDLKYICEVKKATYGESLSLEKGGGPRSKGA